MGEYTLLIVGTLPNSGDFRQEIARVQRASVAHALASRKIGKRIIEIAFSLLRSSSSSYSRACLRGYRSCFAIVYSSAAAGIQSSFFYFAKQQKGALFRALSGGQLQYNASTKVIMKRYLFKCMALKSVCMYVCIEVLRGCLPPLLSLPPPPPSYHQKLCTFSHSFFLHPPILLKRSFFLYFFLLFCIHPFVMAKRVHLFFLRVWV